MSVQQALVAGYNNPLRVVDGADFNGINNDMQLATDLTGITSGKTGILSFWVRFDDVNNRMIFKAATGRFQVEWNSISGSVRILGYTTAAVKILETFTQTGFSAGSAWYHILCAWDLAASTVKLYVNDVSDQQSSPTATNDTIEYPSAGWVVGTSSANYIGACFADFYFAANQYLDIALVANRRKFISASGKPVHLGVTGSLPTGTAPSVYFHLDDGEAVANFATNRGTGGNFTITGALATASSSPSG